MEKREIVALLEALCDRPLGAGGANDPAQLQALCRGAADVLARTQPDRSPTETVAETDRLTALLATVLSGRASEADRALLAETLAGSPTHRTRGVLGAGLSRRHRGLGTAGARRLIDELLRGDAPNKPNFSIIWPGSLSAMANGRWALNWRAAAALVALLFVVGGTWSLYSQQGLTNQPLPAAKSTTPPASVATGAAPAAPPALATAPPCELHAPAAAIGTEADGLPQGQASEGFRKDPNCISPADSQMARQPADQDLAAARARAEAARAQAEAAAKVGAAQTGREPAEGTVQADKAARPFLEPEGRCPAAACRAKLSCRTLEPSRIKKSLLKPRQIFLPRPSLVLSRSHELTAMTIRRGRQMLIKTSRLPLL